MAKKVVFILGPTAVGKTEISLQLADRLQAEIISADSMQVYRGADIGTAKPDERELKEVPHHLIDVCDPHELFSVHEFYQSVFVALEKILNSAHLPMIVGGSGLYLNSLLEGLSNAPGQDASFREACKEKIAREGLRSFYEKLQKTDPEAAQKIDPNDERRIIRALEVFELSGKKMSEWNKEKRSFQEQGYEPLLVGLMRPRAILYKRVHQRVDLMIEQGLIDEAEKIFKRNPSQTMRQAVGYKEIFEYFDGDLTLEEAVEKIKLNTRHLVKKQLTWFRHRENIQWFDLEATENRTNKIEEYIRSCIK